MDVYKCFACSHACATCMPGTLKGPEDSMRFELEKVVSCHVDAGAHTEIEGQPVFLALIRATHQLLFYFISPFLGGRGAES